MPRWFSEWWCYFFHAHDWQYEHCYNLKDPVPDWRICKRCGRQERGVDARIWIVL